MCVFLQAEFPGSLAEMAAKLSAMCKTGDREVMDVTALPDVLSVFSLLLLCCHVSCSAAISNAKDPIWSIAVSIGDAAAAAADDDDDDDDDDD